MVTQLKELNKDCNSFLVGGDQIWNVIISRRYEQFFFLGFVDDKIKKISYATSFGSIYRGNEDEKKITKINLKRFFAISVRDDLSCDILRNVFEIKQVKQVCDPSFLCDISEYKKLLNKAKLNISNEYILAFVLDPNKEIGQRLERLSLEKNISIIILLNYPHQVWRRNKKRMRLRGKGKIDIKHIVNLYE